VPGSPLFFDAHALDDDEWTSRDRALLFLWQTRAHFVRPPAVALSFTPSFTTSCPIPLWRASALATLIIVLTPPAHAAR